jgi:hypothetical protein
VTSLSHSSCIMHDNGSEKLSRSVILLLLVLFHPYLDAVRLSMVTVEPVVAAHRSSLAARKAFLLAKVKLWPGFDLINAETRRYSRWPCHATSCPQP